MEGPFPLAIEAIILHTKRNEKVKRKHKRAHLYMQKDLHGQLQVRRKNLLKRLLADGSHSCVKLLFQITQSQNRLG